MKIWTRESLRAYRRQMGYPDLEPEAEDGVIAILNTVCDDFDAQGGLSYAEPAVRFVPSNDSGGEAYCGLGGNHG